MSAAKDARIGAIIDQRYRILEAIAEGSMGVVYKAERVPLGKLVAIKFLHAAFAQDPEFLARFERETHVMSRLAHPHCVSVLDFGVDDGAPYLVMDYAAGTTLRAWLDDGAVPVGRALAVMRQILAGLAHAHELGVVHRDIKPANIMIADEIGTGDHVRILDFGLARLRGALSPSMTQSYVVVGTPNYMAPEQTVGGAVDARADIYAAGVVLYEMLTGERPFTSDDTLELMAMHRGAPVPRLIDRMPPDAAVPDGLQDVVDRALAKTAAQRWPSAIAMAEALDEVAAALPAPRRPSSAERATSAPDELGTRATGAARAIAEPAPARASTFERAVAELEQAERSERTSGAMRAVDVVRLGSADPTISDTGRDRDPPAPSRRRGAWLAAVAVIAIGGGALALTMRGSGAADARDATTSPAAGATADERGSATGDSVAGGSPTGGSVAGSATGDGAPVAVGGSAAAADDAAGAVRAAAGSQDGGADVAAGPAQDGGASAAQDGGPSIAVGPGGDGGAPGADEPADPANAADPDPNAGRADEAADEAADAPKTTAAAEAVARPATVALARNVGEAIQLIRDGKRDLALASLQALWKHNRNSAYLPFLIGNLYFDRGWWTVAMEHYTIAIGKNPAYKRNGTLVRNLIRALASPKTRGKASTFLRRTIGRSAVPNLKYLATHDPNPTVRKQAAALAKQLR